MGTLLLLLLAVFIVTTLLAGAWTLWFQAYLYTEATSGVLWRAPAAGGAVTAAVLLFVLLDYGNPGRYRPLWEFSASEESKPFAELQVPSSTGKLEVYKLRPGTRGDYRLNGLPTGRPLPTRPSEIIVVEGSEKSVFKPERDAEGHFKQRAVTRFGHETQEPLRYVDERGRVMLEDAPGQLAGRFRAGWFFGNLFVNFVLLGACFAALWPLLGFQWPHALGQAVVVWVVLLLFVLPPLLTQAEEVARARAAPAALPS